MDVTVRIGYEGIIAEDQGNFIGGHWLDGLDEIFGDHAERVDYDTLVIHLPTRDTLALELLDNLIYKGTGHILEVSF